MSEKTQILLLAINLLITVINQFNIMKRVEQLEENQEIMRNYINDKFRKIDNKGE